MSGSRLRVGPLEVKPAILLGCLRPQWFCGASATSVTLQRPGIDPEFRRRKVVRAYWLHQMGEICRLGKTDLLEDLCRWDAWSGSATSRFSHPPASSTLLRYSVMAGFPLEGRRVPGSDDDLSAPEGQDSFKGPGTGDAAYSGGALSSAALSDRSMTIHSPVAPLSQSGRCRKHLGPPRGYS